MKLKVIGSLAFLSFMGAVAATSQAHAATLHGTAATHDSYTASTVTVGHSSSELPPFIKLVLITSDDATLYGLAGGGVASRLAGIASSDKLFDGKDR